MVCKFRKYDSLENSLLDHGKLLCFSMYKSVITSIDYKEACQKVYTSSYCTDHEYPKKLIAIIEENKLYIYDAALAIDGVSGLLTISAIKKLQEILNLSMDGICGPEILSEVKRIMEKPLCSLNSSVYKTAIRYIQWRTGSTIDGIYGNETASLVKNYQKNNKLVADGITGKDTWNRLLS